MTQDDAIRYLTEIQRKSQTIGKLNMMLKRCKYGSKRYEQINQEIIDHDVARGAMSDELFLYLKGILKVS